jgi:hypothetical protein
VFLCQNVTSRKGKKGGKLVIKLLIPERNEKKKAALQKVVLRAAAK